jgi:hypothetical protein
MRLASALNCFVLVYFGGPNYQGADGVSAFADPKPVAPIVESSKTIPYHGVKGLWFPMPIARRMLKDLSTGRSCLSLSSKLELRLEQEITHSQLLELQHATTNRELRIWKDTAKVQAKTLADIHTPPWYLQPYAWAIVGFIIGSAGTVGIVFSIR